MKKIYFITFLAMLAMVSQAQIAHSSLYGSTRKNQPTSSRLWLDLGAGSFTGDLEKTGVALDLGLRYTHMFHENVGWDVIKLSAQTDTKEFSDMLNVQLKTGIRTVTPVLFGNSSLYANFSAGYGYYTYIEKGGFVWEVGAGINITPNISLGVNYNSANFKVDDYFDIGDYSYYDKVKIGIVSLRVAYGF